MAAELVSSATSEKLVELDWKKNIEICELVAQDQRQAKGVIKAIKKRLASKSPNTQLYTVMLLEVLMNNIGDNIYKQVIDTRVLPVLVKMVKKKSDLPVRERIFLLLDATQTSLGGASGKFPQFYTAFYDLVSAGVEFPQRPRATSDPPSTQANNRSTLHDQLASVRGERNAQRRVAQPVSESSIIKKAGNALEVLKEVLDAVDPQNPEGAMEEFTLDLVEQCSFQKECVMHLVMKSRDEKVVSQAIELNEQLQRILVRHDNLLCDKTTVPFRPPLNRNRPNHESSWSSSNGNHHKREPSVSKANGNHFSSESSSSISSVNHLNEEEDEGEEPEQLFRRIRKGKARVRPEDEESLEDRVHPGLFASSIPGELLNRPLIRPLSSVPSPDTNTQTPLVLIPPPPAKHVERERFFQENKADGSGLAGHRRGLSFHHHNDSSSCSGSVDFSD